MRDRVTPPYLWFGLRLVAGRAGSAEASPSLPGIGVTSVFDFIQQCSLVSVSQFIQDCGASAAYAVIFVWTALEGETVVIFAGYAAHNGLLNVYTLIGTAWAGSFLGDQFYFFLGRRYGERLLKRFPRWKLGVDRALRMLERYNTWFILSFRFIYGVRNFSSFAMGMSPLRWSRFLALNFIAAGVWATSFSMFGYGFSSIFSQGGESEAGGYAKYAGLTMLGLFLTVVIVLVRRGKKKMQLEEEAKAKADAGGPMQPAG